MVECCFPRNQKRKLIGDLVGSTENDVAVELEAIMNCCLFKKECDAAASITFTSMRPLNLRFVIQRIQHLRETPRMVKTSSMCDPGGPRGTPLNRITF